jgi:uncharacterized membrane protein
MNPDITSGFASVGIFVTLLSLAVTVGLIVAIFLIAAATRRTARATELLADQVAEIKAYLTSKGE